MKTFDEAVQVILQKAYGPDSLFSQDLKSGHNQEMDNKVVRTLLLQSAEKAIKNVLIDGPHHKDVGKVLADVLAEFTVIFITGRLIGMEMEKQDFKL